MSLVEGPGALAARINAEHRACVAAVNDALKHAMAAGELLIRAKDEHGKHGSWLGWLEQNFEGSDRTARAYMQLWRNRAVVEEAKRQGVAVLGVGEALRRVAIAATHSGPLWGLEGVPGSNPEAARALEEAAEQERRELEEVPGSGPWWERQQKEALAEMRVAGRVREAGEALRPVAEGLYWLRDPSSGYRPEEAGAALARMRGGGDAIAVLREGVAWLTRVIEEAEAARGREG